MPGRVPQSEGHKPTSVNKLEFHGRAVGAEGKVQVNAVVGMHGRTWEDVGQLISQIKLSGPTKNTKPNGQPT